MNTTKASLHVSDEHVIVLNMKRATPKYQRYSFMDLEIYSSVIHLVV